MKYTPLRIVVIAGTLALTVFFITISSISFVEFLKLQKSNYLQELEITLYILFGISLIILLIVVYAARVMTPRSMLRFFVSNIILVLLCVTYSVLSFTIPRYKLITNGFKKWEVLYSSFALDNLQQAFHCCGYEDLVKYTGRNDFCFRDEPENQRITCKEKFEKEYIPIFNNLGIASAVFSVIGFAFVCVSFYNYKFTNYEEESPDAETILDQGLI